MPLKLKDLAKICESTESIIAWLINLNLLLNLKDCICKFCEIGRFGFRKDSSFSRDNYVWRCSNKKCHKKVSVRKGSWFENHNLTLEQILHIIYFWVYRCNQEFVCHELGVCERTIVDWYNYAREVCDNILQTNENNVIGGPGIVVEIDESKFGKRKYHKGRRVDGVWVFGGIERDSKKCFFTTVENRTADTLVNIIKQHIKPGSTIISDCWKAYNSLDKEGFTHLTVNHSVNFVDPNSGAHTNTIESTWRALKKSLPSNGTQKTLYDSYFSQYCIRKLYLNDSTDPFTRFLEIITKVYNPESIKSDFITITPAITTKEPTKKTRVALVDLPQNPNNSLDDFQI